MSNKEVKKKEQKKFNHKISIINQTRKKRLFEKYKDDIYDYIMWVIGGFDFKLDLTVYVKNYKKDKHTISTEIEDARMTIVNKKLAILLSEEVLKSMPYDGGEMLALSLFHELAHIYDYYHVTHNKYFKVNPIYKKQTSFARFIVSKAWELWTEYYAYYKTYRYYKKEAGCLTFLKLVKAYQKLCKQHEELMKLGFKELKRCNRHYCEFIASAEHFLYLSAKYCAGYVTGKVRLYEYSDKIMESECFEFVDDFIYRLYKKISPLHTNTYGKKMAQRLFELGKYVCQKLFEKFNIYPVKENGRYFYGLFEIKN